MDAFDPAVDGLPAEFPIFPLSGALLLPGAKLPLNIFEPRYLAMTEDALATSRMIAMIQPDLGSPPGPTGPKLFRVGCLGRVSSFSESEDGQRYLITLHGVARFTVVEELAAKRGYRSVRGDFSAFSVDLATPASPLDCDRETLLDALRGYFQQHGFEANWDAIRQIDDASLVATLSMVCPFDDVEKQALLEADTPASRAATLLALLRIETHSVRGATNGRPLAS
jgi:Lon protease-like protein